MATIAAARGLAPDRAIGGQIVQANQASLARHLGRDRPGGLAAVEVRALGRCDAPQACPQIPLYQGFTNLEEAAIGLIKNSGAGWPFRQAFPSLLQASGQTGPDRQAVFGQGDGRCHDLSQGQVAVTAMRLDQAGDRTRYADGGMGKSRLVLVHIACFVQVEVAVGLGRGLLAVIQGQGFAAGRMMHKHEAATAQIAGAGQGDGQGETYSHGGVDGVAPLAQDVHAHIRGARLLAGDHAVGGKDGMVAVLVREYGAGPGRRRTGMKAGEKRQ